MKPHPHNDATAEWQTALESVQTAHEENRKMRGILQALVDTIKTHQDTLAATGISTDF
jgi:hypothetical protein